MPTDLGRIALTERQLRATEIMLYRAADLIDRLLKDGAPYTKLPIDATVLPPVGETFPQASQIAPPGGY